MKALLKAAFLASLLTFVTACVGNIVPAASAAQALHHADTGGGMTGDSRCKPHRRR